MVLPRTRRHDFLLKKKGSIPTHLVDLKTMAQDSRIAPVECLLTDHHNVCTHNKCFEKKNYHGCIIVAKKKSILKARMIVGELEHGKLAIIESLASDLCNYVLQKK
jgi:hypothetical protein